MVRERRRDASYTISILILTAPFAFFKTVASSMILPTRFTALAGTGSDREILSLKKFPSLFESALAVAR